MNTNLSIVVRRFSVVNSDSELLNLWEMKLELHCTDRRTSFLLGPHSVDRRDNTRIPFGVLNE